MKKHYLIPIVLIGCSILVMALSYKLDFGVFNNPGPGLMPFLASLLLLLTSLYFIISLLLKKGDSGKDTEYLKEQEERNLWRVILVASSLIVYALLLERLGYLITTSILLIILFRSVGYKLMFSLGISVLTVLITYLFFTYLGLNFPAGILESPKFWG